MTLPHEEKVKEKKEGGLHGFRAIYPWGMVTETRSQPR